MTTKVMTIAGLLVAATTTAMAVPVNYVRTCDQFGAGFLVLPGTDTCLNPDTGVTAVNTETGVVFGQSQIVSKAYEGVALGIAMQSARIEPGKTFGANMNLGTFEGESAFGFGGALQLSDGVSVDATVGLGLNNGGNAGRVGVNFSW